AVGSPPTQKKASILRSLSALTDSATPSRSRLMSLSLSRPAASMRRKAITSVALPGGPVETRLPLRSASFSTPAPSMPTTAMRLGSSTISVRPSAGAPLILSSPLSASSAASTITSATSLLRRRRQRRQAERRFGGDQNDVDPRAVLGELEQQADALRIEHE